MTSLIQGRVDKIISDLSQPNPLKLGTRFRLSLFYSAIYCLHGKMSDWTWVACGTLTCHSESLQTLAYKVWVGGEPSSNMHLLRETGPTIIFWAHWILLRHMPVNAEKSHNTCLWCGHNLKEFLPCPTSSDEHSSYARLGWGGILSSEDDAANHQHVNVINNHQQKNKYMEPWNYSVPLDERA